LHRSAITAIRCIGNSSPDAKNAKGRWILLSADFIEREADMKGRKEEI